MTFFLFLKKRVSCLILFSCFFLTNLSFSNDISNVFSDDVIQSEKADLIAFSFDRPMQLYALLESLEYYVTGIQDIYVICRASNDCYRNAFERVSEMFSHVIFVWQGENPKADFKQLVMHCFNKCACNYILFAVDDNIVTDFIDVGECISCLQKANGYGFYLSLGFHLTECYSHNSCRQAVPVRQHIEKDIYAWTFRDGELEWQYPHTVDMTLYKKSDVESFMRLLPYNSPNTFEAQWASRGGSIFYRIGLCYEHTRVINIPLNRVQFDNLNRHMDCFSSEELLELFEQGAKIDIKPLFKIDNQSRHMPYKPAFVEC